MTGEISDYIKTVGRAYNTGAAYVRAPNSGPSKGTLAATLAEILSAETDTERRGLLLGCFLEAYVEGLPKVGEDRQDHCPACGAEDDGTSNRCECGEALVEAGEEPECLCGHPESAHDEGAYQGRKSCGHCTCTEFADARPAATE